MWKNFNWICSLVMDTLGVFCNFFLKIINDIKDIQIKIYNHKIKIVDFR
jgi:hypothetical protein